MSPKKITDTDKFEIVSLYRQSGETTASLANRYGVSNSTISRLLKITIPEAEYEELIQQKRGSKIGIEGEETGINHSSSVVVTLSADKNFANESIEQSEPTELEPNGLTSTTAPETQISSNSIARDVEKLPTLEDTREVASLVLAPTIAMEIPPITEDLDKNSRRVRRRSSAPAGNVVHSATTGANPPSEAEDRIDLSAIAASPQSPEPTNRPDVSLIAAEEIAVPTQAPVTPPAPRLPVLRSVRPKQDDSFADLATPDSVATNEQEESEEEDVNEDDVSILAAMFGEEIADGDEEDFEDDEDDEEESTSAYQQLDRDRLLTIDRLHIQVTPLSEATLPRTCYIVIDKFAELIVRPLKDFADLGQIPGEEIQQRTLPIFDNHRVAKRFSNQRTQRVIKVPDSKVFHKTSHHLRSKGITRLLVDGNIYSLN